MLSQLVQSHSSQFEAMANSWLDMGATEYKISEYSTCIALWTRNSSHDKSCLTAVVKVRGLTLGELHVKGLDSSFLNRLQAEADFVAAIVLVEGELEGITYELINTQDQLLALYDVARSMRSQVNIPDLLNSAIQLVSQMIQVEGIFTWLKLPDQSVHLFQSSENFLNADSIQWCCRQIFRQKNSLLTNGNDSSTQLPTAIKSVLACPIQVEGQIAGVVGLINRVDVQFTSPDLKLIEAIVQQVEVHIENTLLQEQRVQKAKLQTEMELARNVQLSLLPQTPPHSTELDIASFALPALEVGGDFFDFIDQPNDSLVFTVGDVAGKGMSSALLMAMIRTAMRISVRLLAEPFPKQILDRTNEDLYDDFTEVGMFATVFVGYHVPKTHTLIYANAGHSPVIYCPKDGVPRMLEADGTAVGVLPMNLAENQEIPFGSGDVLIVATDGFAEARNPEGELFGYEQLLELASTLTHLDANSILNKLYQTIYEFGTGSHQDDDQTVIVIKGK